MSTSDRRFQCECKSAKAHTQDGRPTAVFKKDMSIYTGKYTSQVCTHTIRQRGRHLPGSDIMLVTGNKTTGGNWVDGHVGPL